MKRLVVFVVSIFMIGLSAHAYAETTGSPQMQQSGQGQMGMCCMGGDMKADKMTNMGCMGGGKAMNMGCMGKDMKAGMMMGKQQCMSMMQDKMAQGMMMKEMMQMMMGMMDMQQGMMKEMSPEERKAMMTEAGKMKEKMGKMMSGMGNMTMPCMMGSSVDQKADQEKKDAPQQDSAPKQEQHKH